MRPSLILLAVLLLVATYTAGVLDGARRVEEACKRAIAEERAK